MAYGGSKAGDHWCWLTVKATTVPRPDTTVGTRSRLRHTWHTGTGGCTSAPQSPHPWMRSWPSFPHVQNHSLVGVSSGSGRNALSDGQMLRRKPIASLAAGNDPVTPAAK